MMFALGAVSSAVGQQETSMRPRLAAYMHQCADEYDLISAERRELLGQVTTFVRDRHANDDKGRLIFVCTHNSRRSQFAQVWAAAAAAYYDVRGIETFSGGTEATAFNPRAAAALARAGWKIEKTADGPNPILELSYDDLATPLRCFSKVYSEAPNPERDFAAIMTCSQADRTCPQVSGATLRIAIPYDDPKVADGLASEEQVYDERCRQIAREMLYIFSLLK